MAKSQSRWVNPIFPVHNKANPSSHFTPSRLSLYERAWRSKASLAVEKGSLTFTYHNRRLLAGFSRLFTLKVRRREHSAKTALRKNIPLLWSLHEEATILDKTVEKIVYLDSIFLNIVAVPVLPSPPSPESNVVVYSEESLIPGRLWEATLNWGKGFSFRKGVVLEIVLLRRKVDMMGKTFSSSFVRDCRWKSVPPY